eukprot:7438337-Heterocapsa_arctica.AAC.1
MSFCAVASCALPQRSIDVFPRGGELCAPATQYRCPYLASTCVFARWLGPRRDSLQQWLCLR